MIYEIIIYIVAYFIDMFSAILFWKKKPNLFEKAETNQQLKNLLKKFKIPKAILMYTLCVALEYFIIVCLAIFLSLRVINGEWDILFALRFTLVFMIFVHLLGTLTNIISMMKKEVISPIMGVKEQKEVKE